MINFCQITEHPETQSILYLLKLNDSNLFWQVTALHNVSQTMNIKEIRIKLEQMLDEKIPGSKLLQCIVLNNLWTFLPPFILLFGTFGNILAFFVICQRNLLTTSSYVYLAAIAIIDELILLTGLLRRWSDHLIGSRIEDSNKFFCKIFQFIGVTVSFSSVWLIVVMTIERLIVIKLPFQVHSLISPNKVKLYIIVLISFLSILSSHFFETVSLNNPNNTNSIANNVPQYKCNFKERYINFIRYWMVFEALFYSIIPFILLIVLNGIILKETYKAGKTRSTLINYGQTTRQLHSMGNHRNKMTSSGSHMSYETKQLTVMLVTISVAFLCTTTPLVTYKLILKVITSKDDVRYLANLQLMDTIFELLMYINHSINFYIYCASGRRFRIQLRRIFNNHESITTSISFAKNNGRMFSLVNSVVR